MERVALESNPPSSTREDLFPGWALVLLDQRKTCVPRLSSRSSATAVRPAWISLLESGPAVLEERAEHLVVVTPTDTADQENLNSPITSKRMTTFLRICRETPHFSFLGMGAFLTVVAAALVEAASPRSQVRKRRGMACSGTATECGYEQEKHR